MCIAFVSFCVAVIVSVIVAVIVCMCRYVLHKLYST